MSACRAGALPWTAQVSPTAAAALAAAAAAIRVDDAGVYEAAEQARIAAALAAGAPDALAAVIAAIEERLARAPRFAIVRGLPAHATTLFLAFSAHLGTLVEPYRPSKIFREIRPGTDRAHRGRALNTLLHTDSTDWPVPNDLTCLWCVRPDPAGGGRSRLLAADDFVAHVCATAGADAAALLATPVPWRLSGELGGGVHHAPIAAAGEVRWMRYTIEAAGADLGDALARIERTTEAAGGVIDAALGAGDVLVVDNRRALHGRTPVDDAASPRLLLRTKLRR